MYIESFFLGLQARPWPPATPGVPLASHQKLIPNTQTEYHSIKYSIYQLQRRRCEFILQGAAKNKLTTFIQ